MYLRIALKIMQPSWANSSLPSNDLPMMIMMMMIAAMIIWLRLEIWGGDMINASCNPFSLLVLKMRWPKNQPPWSVIHSRPIPCQLYFTKCLVCSTSGVAFCKLARWLFLQLVTCKATFYLICLCFFCHNPTRWRLIRMDWSVSTTFLAKVTQTNENEKQCWVGRT